MRGAFQSALRSGERSDAPDVVVPAAAAKFQSALRSGERSDEVVRECDYTVNVSIRAPLG